jgi:hypothetical protein
MIRRICIPSMIGFVTALCLSAFAYGELTLRDSIQQLCLKA